MTQIRARDARGSTFAVAASAVPVDFDMTPTKADQGNRPVCTALSCGLEAGRMVSTMQSVDTIVAPVGHTIQGKRTHSEQFRSRVVRECDEPGASIAAVALRNGVNANLVHKWRRRSKNQVAAPATPVLLPITVTTPRAVAPAKPAPRRSSAIELELYGVRVSVREGFDADALRAVVQVLRDTAA
jgi:transposase